MSNKIKIAITGPESTGKSTMAAQLAEHFRCSMVEEYARTFIEQLDRKYTIDDLFTIAKEQYRRQNEAYEEGKGWVIYDTSLLTIKIWSLDKFGSVDQWIERNFLKEHIDLYLLCNIDLPWKEDDQREDPFRREEIMQLYEHHLKANNMFYRVVSGLGNERLEQAIQHIESFQTGR